MSTPNSPHVDLTNARGERIGRLVRIGLSWQAFAIDPASDSLRYLATYASKSDARSAVMMVAGRAA